MMVLQCIIASVGIIANLTVVAVFLYHKELRRKIPNRFIINQVSTFILTVGFFSNIRLFSHITLFKWITSQDLLESSTYNKNCIQMYQLCCALDQQ